MGIIEMDKLKKLNKILKELGSVVVAFSGGVDSSFLLRVAKDVLPKKDILAVTALSDTYTPSELKQARRFTKSLGLKHRVIFTNELKDKDFIKNSKDRCYFCKKELFKKLAEITCNHGLWSIVDASNVDDKKDYRPGTKAKKELGVRSPLQEAGFTKNDIRRFSKSLGLNTWNLPSMACLASRIPYGQKICKSTLKNIASAEEFIRDLGIRQVRVRCHGDIARIEIEKKDIKRFLRERFCGKISRHLRSLGFQYIVLDLDGYRTGSLNEVIR